MKFIHGYFDKGLLAGVNVHPHSKKPATTDSYAAAILDDSTRDRLRPKAKPDAVPKTKAQAV